MRAASLLLLVILLVLMEVQSGLCWGKEFSFTIGQGRPAWFKYDDLHVRQPMQLLTLQFGLHNYHYYFLAQNSNNYAQTLEVNIQRSNCTCI